MGFGILDFVVLDLLYWICCIRFGCIRFGTLDLVKQIRLGMG